jgi:ABC-2 type transport system permease protein
MNKIWLIIRREYLTRVRKKTFIISTILFPVLYLGLIFGMAYLGVKSKSRLHIAVIDSSGYFNKGQFERANQADSSVVLNLLTSSSDSLKQNYENLGYDGFVVIPQTPDWEKGIKNVTWISGKKYGDARDQIERKLNVLWNDIKNEKLGIDDNKKTIINTSRISVESKNLADEASNEGAAKGIAFIAGFLIYLIFLIYGSQVMER